MLSDVVKMQSQVSLILVNWRSTQINQRPVSIWMDGWDWGWIGWLSQEIGVLRVPSVITRNCPFECGKKCIKQPWIYTWKDHPLPFPIHLAGFTGVCTNILHPGDESCSLTSLYCSILCYVALQPMLGVDVPTQNWLQNWEFGFFHMFPNAHL